MNDEEWRLYVSEIYDDTDDNTQDNRHSDIESHGEKSDLSPYLFPDDGHGGQTWDEKTHENGEHYQLLFGDDSH